MKFIDQQDRSKLNEGRTKGLGFAFCQMRGDELHTVHPISCCKDYLSDVVYSERTGNDYFIYGLQTKKLGLFESSPGYIAMRINKDGVKDSKVYPSMDADIKSLEGNHQNMQGMVNWFEGKLKLDQPLKIEKLGDNLFLVTVGDWWTRYCWSVSLLSLLLRCALRWDGTVDPLVFLSSGQGLEYDDIYMADKAAKRMKIMIEGKFPVQDMTAYKFNPHNSGIYSVDFS